MALGAGAEAERAVGAPATTSEIEADVVDTVPKTMQGKARRLMERMKRNMSWTTRGELIHEGAPIVGSNVVDLVNDVLRKRKTDPTGWQPFARQLRAEDVSQQYVGSLHHRLTSTYRSDWRVGMRVGRDTVPAYVVQHRNVRHLVLP